MLQGHRYTLLLAVGWTTVTVYLPVSVVNCYKLFRTLPLVLLQELESASVWLLSCVSFIGYQFDGRSRSRQQFWYTSVNMVRLRDTWQSYVDVNVHYWPWPLAFCGDETACRSQNEDGILWRPKLCRTGTSYLEQSTCWAVSSMYFTGCTIRYDRRV